MNRLSSTMALVGCGTLWVERIERMPASIMSRQSCSGNSACVTTASIVVAPAVVSALAQAIMVPPEETISSTIKVGRPAMDARSGNLISTEAVTATDFLRNYVRKPKPAGEIADPGLRFRIRSHHDGCGIKTGFAQRDGYCWHRRQIVGRDPGKHRCDVGRAMQMRIDGDHAVEPSGEQRADDLLTDGFAFVEGRVLSHVAEIGRQQDEAFRTSAPERLGREGQSDQLFVRPVERRIDDGHRRCRCGSHPYLPVGKPMDRNLVKGYPEPRCQPGGVP